ncbi:MAG: SurA N-terminal domain-containing protein [Desulfobacteraceae bacterium]|nr:SurA N-terminal domain-containing protein [Desulfobacteraceae bacterium]
MVKKISIFMVIFSMVCVFSNVSRSEVIDKIVAVVNEDIITLVELNKAIKPYLVEVEKTAYSETKKGQIINKLQTDMLNKLIEFKLTEQEAERLNIKVSDKELKASVERFLETKNINEEELKKALLKEKMTYEEYESEMRSQILRPKLINRVIRAKVVITNEEIKEYYEEHEKEYIGVSKYHLRNVLADGEEEIEKIKSLLDQGKDFKEIAKQYSQAPNASSDGDLGAFELDVFAENIRENILLLEKDQYTDIILTDGGFQIFFLEKIEMAGGKTLDQAKDEIVKKLFTAKAEKKYTEWFEELKGMSHIKTTL